MHLIHHRPLGLSLIPSFLTYVLLFISLSITVAAKLKHTWHSAYPQGCASEVLQVRFKPRHIRLEHLADSRQLPQVGSCRPVWLPPALLKPKGSAATNGHPVRPACLAIQPSERISTRAIVNFFLNPIEAALKSEIIVDLWNFNHVLTKITMSYQSIGALLRDTDALDVSAQLQVVIAVNHTNCS